VGSDLGAAVRGFKKAMSEGEDEQSAQQKQIRSDKPDAEFDEVRKGEAQTTQTKTDRSA
jgi:Sec-independent protein translocase protein TatA